MNNFITNRQYRVLCYIRECQLAGEPALVSQLARHFGMSHDSMRRTVKRLQVKGFVTYRRRLPVYACRMPYSEGVAA